MLYVAAIRLRYTQPDVERSYKLPWGNFGMWLISGIGILAVTFAFILEFFPPKQLPVGGPLFYVLFLGIGTAVFVIIPFIIIRLKKSEWKTVSDSRKDN
jgi:amino acid transporter